MLSKAMIIIPAALMAAIPLTASAEAFSQSELAMFNSAKLTVQQAGDAALQSHAGKLATVTFGDEDGRAAYEAVVVSSDGQPWTVLVDVKTGEVFASALSSSMEDHADHGQGMSDDDHDGEADND